MIIISITNYKECYAHKEKTGCPQTYETAGNKLLILRRFQRFFNNLLVFFRLFNRFVHFVMCHEPCNHRTRSDAASAFHPPVRNFRPTSVRIIPAIIICVLFVNNGDRTSWKAKLLNPEHPSLSFHTIYQKRFYNPHSILAIL